MNNIKNGSQKINYKWISLNIADDGYEYVSRLSNRDSVLIIPYLFIDVNVETKYQLITQPRTPFENKLVLEFPAGMIDENENILEAAIRELEEETRWKFTGRIDEKYNIDIMARNSPTAPGITNEVVNIVSVNLKNCNKLSFEESLKDNDSSRINILPLMTKKEISEFIKHFDGLVSSKIITFLIG